MAQSHLKSARRFFAAFRKDEASTSILVERFNPTNHPNFNLPCEDLFFHDPVRLEGWSEKR